MHGVGRRGTANERRPRTYELPPLDLRQLAWGVRLQGARRRTRLHLLHDLRAAHRWDAAGSCRRLSLDGGVPQVRAVTRHPTVEDLVGYPVVLRLVVSELRRERRRANARERHLVRG